MGHGFSKHSIDCVPNKTYCGSSLSHVLYWPSYYPTEAERKAKPNGMRIPNFMTSLYLCTGPRDITWLADCNNGFCWPSLNTTDKTEESPQPFASTKYNYENTKNRPDDTCVYPMCTEGSVYCAKELLEDHGFVLRTFQDYFELVYVKNREPMFTMEELHVILDSSRFLCKANNLIEFYDNDISGCN